MSGYQSKVSPAFKSGALSVLELDVSVRLTDKRNTGSVWITTVCYHTQL